LRVTDGLPDTDDLRDAEVLQDIEGLPDTDELRESAGLQLH